MKDRVPLYKGRVKLVPVAGQENIYDMTRADSPQQIGTKLNKANLLTDETAAKIWPDESERPADPTPNDALAALVRPEKTAVGSYVGTGETSDTFGVNDTGSYVLNARAIIRVEDTLVALDTYGKVHTSTDNGETWVQKSDRINTNSSWNSIAYGNGVYVAVASGFVAWSSNLENWTVQAVTSNTTDLGYVTFGDGTFVLSLPGSPYKMFYSDDGKTYTEATTDVSDVRGYLIYAEGKFVCIGAGYGTASNKGKYSADKGRTWQEISLPKSMYFYKGLCYARGEYVVLGANGTNTSTNNRFTVYTSADLAEWKTGPALYGGNEYATAGALVYDEETDNLWFFWESAGSSSSKYWFVSCGANDAWIRVNRSYNYNVYGAVVADGRVVLVGYIYISSSTSAYNFYILPIPSVYIATDFRPKFAVVYQKGFQPCYENSGATNHRCLYVTSNQIGIHVQYSDTNTHYSVLTVCKDDGLYIYGDISLRAQGIEYTYFVAG